MIDVSREYEYHLPAQRQCEVNERRTALLVEVESAKLLDTHSYCGIAGQAPSLAGFRRMQRNSCRDQGDMQSVPDRYTIIQQVLCRKRGSEKLHGCS